MLNYIRKRLALDSTRIETIDPGEEFGGYGKHINYFPGKNEENPLFSDNSDNALDNWIKISKMLEGLPIFKNPKEPHKFIYVNKKLDDTPEEQNYRSNIYLHPNNLLYGVGDMLAREMDKHPQNMYHVEDLLQDEPEQYIHEFNKEHDSPSFVPQNRYTLLLHTIPHLMYKWGSHLLEHGGNLKEHLEDDKNHEGEGVLTGLLRHAIISHANKGYALALNPDRWAHRPHHSMYVSEENSPQLDLYGQENPHKTVKNINKLVHIVQSYPELLHKIAIISHPNYPKTAYNKPDVHFHITNYHIHPDVFARTFGHIMTQGLNLQDNNPVLHDLIEDYRNGDPHAQTIIKDFHKRHDIPLIQYSSPEELRNVVGPVYYGNLLSKMKVNLDHGYTPREMNEYLSTPQKNEGGLESLLRENAKFTS